MAETVQKGNGASLKWLCLVTEILMSSKFPAKNKKFNPIIYNGRPLYIMACYLNWYQHVHISYEIKGMYFI